MTEQEKQEIILAVLGGLKVHSMTIDQLTESTTVGDSDYIELNGGRKISFKKFSELVLGQIAENIRMKANLNTQNALATGEEQRLVIRIIEKSERPVILMQGVYYNENSQLIETYVLRDMHGSPVLRMVLSEEPSKNVVYCDEDTNTLLRWDGSEMVTVGGGTTDVYTKAETNVLLAEKADDNVTYYDLEKQEQKEGTVAEGVLANSLGVFSLVNYIEQIVEQVAGKADKATLNSYAKLFDITQNIQAGVIGANQSLNTPFINLGGADLETVDGRLQVDGENVAMVKDIPSGEGYNKIVYSPNMLIQKQKPSWAESERIFKKEEVNNVCVIAKLSNIGRSVSNNHYRANTGKTNTIVGIYKDDNNYFSVTIDSYQLNIKHNKGGVLNTINLKSTINGNLNSGSSYYCNIDFVQKKVLIVNYYSNAFHIIEDYDFSAISVDFDVFNVVVGMNDFSQNAYSYYVGVNANINYYDIINSKPRYGYYNTYPVRGEADVLSYGTTNVYLDGQNIETLGDKHKKCHYNKTSSSYFGLGVVCENSSINNVFCSFMAKFSNISDNTLISSGAGFSEIKVYDGETCIDIDNSSNFSFKPVEGKTYKFVIGANIGGGVGYVQKYGFKCIGEFDVEIYEPLVFNEQLTNICAETCDGKYSLGDVKFKTNDLIFTSKGAVNLNSGVDIPIGMVCSHTDGKLYMCDGNVWKQINNA